MAFVLLLFIVMSNSVDHIYMPDGFKGDFISFLQSCNVSFQMVGEGVFLFHEHKLRIKLVLLSDFEQNGCLEQELSKDGYDTLYLYEDRWRFQREFVQKRILARLGRFRSVFARKCKVITNEQILQGNMSAAQKKQDRQRCEKIPLREQIDSFLEQNHMYGKAKCRYRYALEYEGQIVAVATFSESRPMPRTVCDMNPRPISRAVDDVFSADRIGIDSVATDPVAVDGAGIDVVATDDVIIFDSYEWVRYASLPDCRVVGGMGRLLKAFLNDVHAIGIAHLAKVAKGVTSTAKLPVDEAEGAASTIERPVEQMKGVVGAAKRPVEVMSYSDTEWSQGAVYESLGFKLHQQREPVWFYVNKNTGERISVNKVSRQGVLSGYQLEKDFVKIYNCGSRKYLLQLL